MNHIPHRPGDPVTFDTYRGQEAIKRRLELRLNAMRPGDTVKALFHAPAGQGKTALVRVLAHEMLRRKKIHNYFETIAGKFESKNDLDLFLRQIPADSMVFIDEIHGLAGTVRDAFYPALQDNVYMYNSNLSVVRLPSGIHWIGATTDLGKCHPALQRRLIPMALEPLTLEDRTWIALLQPRKVATDAAIVMAERCWSPWEIKDELYATAADIATEDNNTWEIKLDHVLAACGLLGVDANGLRPKDRLILDCLYKHPRKVRGEIVYSLAGNALVIMAGLDMATYTDAIEPKLMRLGYITVRAGVGRILTRKAIDDYFNGKENIEFFQTTH